MTLRSDRGTERSDALSRRSCCNCGLLIYKAWLQNNLSSSWPHTLPPGPIEYLRRRDRDGDNGTEKRPFRVSDDLRGTMSIISRRVYCMVQLRGVLRSTSGSASCRLAQWIARHRYRRFPDVMLYRGALSRELPQIESALTQDFPLHAYGSSKTSTFNTCISR